jgi:hypothetical protein
MATFAVINEGIVENCIVADSLEIAQEITGLTCVEYTSENSVSVGFTYADEVFTDPNPPIPPADLPPSDLLPTEEE